MKQIALVPEVLTLVDRPLSWIHFGDGTEAARVLAAAEALPEQIDWKLAGWVPNQEVTQYYATQPVSLLLSMSRHEGIPVSMMEAQSFGIPIVALDVGAIGELVTPDTGILVPDTAAPSEVADAVREALEPGRFDRQRIREQFLATYWAQIRYERFGDTLARIRESTGETLDGGDRKLPVTITTVLFNSAAGIPGYAGSVRPLLATGAVEVIAVDNASPDDSAAAFAKLLPEATLIRSPLNGGFAAGCNLAWPQVESQYWLLLNPDVEIDPAGMETLIAWMDGHPRVAAASPRLRTPDGKEVPVPRAPDSLWRPLLEILRIHKLLPGGYRIRLLLPGRPRDPEEFRGWVPGAAMIVRTDAVRAVGLMDESLFMYGEDRDWCARFCHAGWTIGFCQDTTFVHEGSGSANASWNRAEVIQREVRGHIRSITKRRGRTYSRALAVLHAALLGSASLRAPGDGPDALRARAQAYLRAAVTLPD
jgi:GT2 family glycosyltransferase